MLRPLPAHPGLSSADAGSAVGPTPGTPLRAPRATRRWAVGGLFASAATLLAAAAVAADRRRFRARPRPAVWRRARPAGAAPAVLVPDAFYRLDAVHDAGGALVDFVIADVNAAGRDLFRSSTGDLVGQRLGALFPHAPPSGRGGLGELYRQVYATGRAYEGEYRTRDARTAAEWLAVRITPAAGGIALTCRDVSALKRAGAGTPAPGVRAVASAA